MDPNLDSDELSRLIAAVRSAEQAVDTLHGNEPADDAPDDARLDFALKAGQRVAAERKIRDRLIAFLLEAFETSPVAITLSDGSIVAYDAGTRGGLAVVPAENVHKL